MLEREVADFVDEERWDQGASAAAIYVEDEVRRWSGNPLDEENRKLVGQAPFVKALSSNGPLALGSQSNETDRWRNLRTGLVAAISNVDRHGVQDRSGQKQNALGVLGLASLLITQMKHDPSKTAT